MEVRVKQESQDEALVPLCAKTNAGGALCGQGPMQKVPSLSDLSDPESSLGESRPFVNCLFVFFSLVIALLAHDLRGIVSLERHLVCKGRH